MLEKVRRFLGIAYVAVIKIFNYGRFYCDINTDDSIDKKSHS